ncbi:MAG: hypothetical protein WC446_00035 [Candidatus Paceibacterota bacterium]|jgi:hypothetical protein
MDIKEILKKSDRIGILTKKNANNDAIGASLALFFALREAGKKACFPSKNIPEEIFSFAKNEENKKFQISFNEDVSEVYYEKKEKGIVIYLTPKDKNIDDERFSCKIISKNNFFSSEYDILVTIGIDDFKEVENLCGPDELFNCTIINIDNKTDNQNYGEINIIKVDQSLSQTIACLLKDIEEYKNQEANNFLLYGLAFSNKKTDNDKKINTIKWLLKNGGNLSLFSKEQEKNKLLEIVLKNLDCKKNIYISTVSESEFDDSKTTSKSLGLVVEKLKNFLNISSFFILWETKSSISTIKGLFYTNKKYIVNKINNNFEGSYKEKGGIFLTEEYKINIAKEKIISYLNYGNN